METACIDSAPFSSSFLSICSTTLHDGRWRADLSSSLPSAIFFCAASIAAFLASRRYFWRSSSHSFLRGSLTLGFLLVSSPFNSARAPRTSTFEASTAWQVSCDTQLPVASTVSMTLDASAVTCCFCWRSSFCFWTKALSLARSPPSPGSRAAKCCPAQLLPDVVPRLLDGSQHHSVGEGQERTLGYLESGGRHNADFFRGGRAI